MDMSLPPNIENYSKMVADLQSRDRLTSDQKKKLAVCKLKIALWACQSEGMQITRYNLSEILGPDTMFVFEHGQIALMEVNWESKEDRRAMSELMKSRKSGRKKGDGGDSVDLGTYS